MSKENEHIVHEERKTFSLAHVLKTEKFLPSLVAGLFAGILTIIGSVSYAALIFEGGLSGFLSQGIGFILFGSFITLVLTSL